MKSIKSLFFSAVLMAVPLSAVAHAQTGAIGKPITINYNIDDLMNRPALITLGKGDMTFLQYDSDVDAVITPQGSLMDIPDPMGNLVVLTGKVSTGGATMMIRLTNGKYTPFVIKFVPGNNTIKQIHILDNSKNSFSSPTNDYDPSLYTAPLSDSKKN